VFRWSADDAVRPQDGIAAEPVELLDRAKNRRLIDI
jgi:hypothetical protein